MVDIICPYKATNNKSCSNKGTKKNRGGKRCCGFNFPHNCELFIKWFNIKEKSQDKRSKAQIEATKN